MEDADKTPAYMLAFLYPMMSCEQINWQLLFLILGAMISCVKKQNAFKAFETPALEYITFQIYQRKVHIFDRLRKWCKLEEIVCLFAINRWWKQIWVLIIITDDNRLPKYCDRKNIAACFWMNSNRRYSSGPCDWNSLLRAMSLSYMNK